VSQALHGPTLSEPLDSIEHYWHIGPPKSDAAYRTIAISDQTCAALAPLMAGKQGDDLIFSAPGRTGTGGRVSASHRGAYFVRPVVDGVTMDFEIPINALKESIVWRNLKGATGKCPRVGLLERVGIPQQFRLHDFRHTHVAWCANNDPPISLDVVSRRLGHESIVVTYDRYNHLYPGRDRAAATAMDKALRRPVSYLIPIDRRGIAA
jgi:integrase